MKDKTTAAILAFLLGGVGAHKFYLGKIAQGFVYLIFFWTFIPAIISFFEFIIYLSMDTEKFNQKYNPANQFISNSINSNSKGGSDVAEEIEKLHELKEKGVLTDEEFKNRKAKLL